MIGIGRIAAALTLGFALWGTKAQAQDTQSHGHEHEHGLHADGRNA
jgi:hypothetical protein